MEFSQHKNHVVDSVGDGFDVKVPSISRLFFRNGVFGSFEKVLPFGQDVLTLIDEVLAFLEFVILWIVFIQFEELIDFNGVFYFVRDFFTDEC